MSQTISIDVVGDYDIENNEEFLIHLTSPTNATIIANDPAVGTIINDDEGADLSISLIVTPEIAEVSDILTYTLQVSNNGPETALDTTATLNLYDKVQFIDATTTQGLCTHVNSIVSCQLGDLLNGQNIDIIVHAQVVDAGTIYAQANASSSTTDDADGSNNVASFGVSSSALAIPALSLWSLLLMIVLLLFAYKIRNKLSK